MKKLDLKWYEKIEEIEDFLIKAGEEGWEVDISFGSDELLELRIKKMQQIKGQARSRQT